MQLNKSLPSTTPKKLYTSKKIDVFQLHIFRAKAYIQISKHKRDKMASKISAYVLVIINKYTKRYHCFNPCTKSILIFHDVTFDEYLSPQLLWKVKEAKPTAPNQFKINIWPQVDTNQSILPSYECFLSILF